MDKIEKFLENIGWCLECHSPFEISHPDGSFARGAAADYLLNGLKEDYLEEWESVGLN